MNESDHFVLDTQLDSRCGGIYDSYPSERPDYNQPWNGTVRSERTPLRGILRNNHSRALYGNANYAQTLGYDTNDHACNSVNAVLRAGTAELISVLITVFISQHVESAIVEHHLNFLQKIALLALVDASLVLVFVSAFRTVHISPVISLAQLFAVTTSWIMCILFVLVQLVASVTAVFLYNFLRNIPVNSIASINQDVKTDWIKSVYSLVVLQFCGTTMVVMSNLMITSRQGRKHTYVGAMTGNPLCLFASIMISSFLSLSQSTVRWNPLHSLAVSIFFALRGEHSPWASHYIYWIGALGGSMFACFLFRLFFAPEDKRLTTCCCTSEGPEAV